MAQQSVYVISVAAELAGVHPQTLRIYERKGLLEPKRTAGNTRRYSDDDIARLRRIQQLTQQQGVNLAGVRIVMELEKRLREMEARLVEAERRHREVVSAAAEAIEEAHRSHRAELVPVRLASLPAVVPPRRR